MLLELQKQTSKVMVTHEMCTTRVMMIRMIVVMVVMIRMMACVVEIIRMMACLVVRVGIAGRSLCSRR